MGAFTFSPSDIQQTSTDMLSPLILLLILVASTLVGYFLIKNVPSLLHTPLMSGMNALSGVTLVGAISAAAAAWALTEVGSVILGQILGALAIILATINVVGGFAVTERMLRMFNRKR